ncbi:diaminopimelate epimerase [Lentibacillus halodurans]|uniref:Diaminopimelate epimerase n=1 Tax=Lentibacillus halodurans TaxID=237679 RepID=A0A1I0WTK4_9BACI|nr:diaminopimelate epimerase [Lentibacillus halodurans]SFA91336.1 diaminopimelate epimerase [Lentibacillus halodurans]
MKVPFTKMHGLGNNYIYIDLFQVELKEEGIPDLARKVSDIHTGIGSDGLILIHPSEVADVGMRIFNKDGSEAKSCGNGLRCVAKYAFEHDIVNQNRFKIETRANIVEAKVLADSGAVREITVNMGEPVLKRSLIPMTGNDTPEVVAERFDAADSVLELTAVSMGNPHAVFFVEDIDKAPLYELGPVIESDARFPDGVNVEFIEVVSPKELNFRVWERGSGVTQACGTGACAAVVAAVLNGKVARGNAFTVHLAGGDLRIEWSKDGNVWMTGGAEVIAAGEFYYDQVRTG